MAEIKIKSIEQSNAVEPVTGRKLQVTIQEVDFLDDDGDVILTSITKLIFPAHAKQSELPRAADIVEKVHQAFSADIVEKMDVNKMVATVKDNFEWPAPGPEVTLSKGS